MDSDGSLRAVAKALVNADEAWTPARTKLKRPSEWIVSTLRLTAAPWNTTAGPWNIGRVLGVQAGLGESLWRPPAPNGWPDTEAAWIDGETNMGPAWRDTVVALVTEFGRTARINGTDGTDHGTATVALLLGGALKGGRVIADWPGLKPASLYENRDLKPTTDLRAVLKGLLKDHLRADERVLADNVFPGSKDVKPIAGLLA
jgi:Protein of unknown function (DUF1800)/Protein of unknown function (DUF1501)